MADPGRRADLNEWLTHKVLMVEEGRKAGHTFSQPDLIIAATALHRALAVVSRGIADYQRACIPLHNP